MWSNISTPPLDFPHMRTYHEQMRDDSPLSNLLSARLTDSTSLEDAVSRISLEAEQDELWLNGGLRADGLHEFYAASKGDLTSANGFALLMAYRRCQEDGRPLIWAREAKASGQGGQPYGHGLSQLGLNPDAITLLSLPDSKALLRAALDVARDGAIGSLVVELAGQCPLLGLTESRRFALAAASSNICILFSRGPIPPPPSAAHSRWQVASAPSRALAANAPGAPAFTLDLLRQRGGRDGLNIIMEWNRDTASFHARGQEKKRISTVNAPLSRAAPAVAFGGEKHHQRPRAA